MAAPFVLLPHPALPAPPFSIAGDIARGDGRLVVRYLLRGDTGALRVPPPAAPGAADGLWQHTCCELFLAAGDAPAYREFNFSPSAQWASYAFAGYRLRDAATEAAAPVVPVVDCRAGADVLELRATLPLAALPSGDWRLGLSAVLETRDGGLSWWALRHPGERPDFHHRDGFALALTERP